MPAKMDLPQSDDLHGIYLRVNWTWYFVLWLRCLRIPLLQPKSIHPLCIFHLPIPHYRLLWWKTSTQNRKFYTTGGYTGPRTGLDIGDAFLHAVGLDAWDVGQSYLCNDLANNVRHVLHVPGGILYPRVECSRWRGRDNQYNLGGVSDYGFHRL